MAASQLKYRHPGLGIILKRFIKSPQDTTVMDLRCQGLAMLLNLSGGRRHGPA
jgi:hypothetical protein